MELKRYLDKILVALAQLYLRQSTIRRGRGRVYAAGRRRAKNLGRIKSRTVYGGALWCNGIDLLQRNILFFGIWEPALTDFVRRTLKQGDVFVDVGANIGYFTILAAKVIGPEGRCVSIEALPSTAKQLEENVQLNRCDNVRVVRKAVMNHRGEIKIFAGRDQNIGASTTLPGRGYTSFDIVEAAPLHELLTSDEMHSAGLIKIDVEGAEFHVIESLLSNIGCFSPDVTFCIEIAPSELRKHGTSLLEIVDRFRASGFDASILELDHPTYDYLHHEEKKLNKPISFSTLSSQQRTLLEERPHVDVIFS